jgi:prevent-host-death family protein
VIGLEITSNELKNNLEKYLKLCQKEEIIITVNGLRAARLSAYKDSPDFIDMISEEVAE